MTENPTHADGWVLKKPTSQSGKSWSGSSLQRRFLESRGYSVAYYADEASRRPKGTKPRGTFDLREVSTLRKSPDPTAPDTALELVVKKHAFTLSFQSDFERDNFLRIWVNGVPASAVPKELLEQFQNGALAASLVGSADTPRGPTNGAPVSASATGAAVPPPPPPPASSTKPSAAEEAKAATRLQSINRGKRARDQVGRMKQAADERAATTQAYANTQAVAAAKSRWQ